MELALNQRQKAELTHALELEPSLSLELEQASQSLVPRLGRLEYEGKKE